MKTEQVRKIMRRIIEEILLRRGMKKAMAKPTLPKSAEKGIGVSSQPTTTPTAPKAPKTTGTKRPTAKKKPKANGK